MLAPRFECLLFDPFPELQNGFVAPEVNVGGCDVVQERMNELRDQDTALKCLGEYSGNYQHFRCLI